MAASLVQSKARGLTSASQPNSITLDAAATAGNYLVVAYSTFGSEPSVPTGWTKLFWESSGGDSCGAYYKVAAGGETGVDFGTRAFDGALSIEEWSGITGISTTHLYHTTGLSGAGPFTSTALTLDYDGAVLVAFFHIRDTATPLAAGTASAPFSTDATADNGFNRTAAVGHYQSAKVTGQTETVTWTVPNSSYDRGASVLIQLQPSASVDVEADGALPTIDVVALAGTAETGTSVTASGIVPNVRLIAMTGSSSAGDVTAAADLPTVTVSPMGGQAVGPDVAFVSEGFAEAIGEVVADARVSEAWAEAIGVVHPDMKVTEAYAEVLVNAAPCTSRWAQFWSIKRHDGVTLRFTSHDRTIPLGVELYQTCASLSQSASESASDMGSVGSVTVDGILDSEAITEEDLFGGLYDDAYVEVWLAPWDSTAKETPRRIAAGWCGQLSHGERGFRMEVVGPGARLSQQPLVDVVTPDCRWAFGGTECGVDKEALSTSATVLSAASRMTMTTDVLPVSGDAFWDNGTVRFLYGRNAGVTVEVKTVDFQTGVIVLWAPLPFVPEAGDDFTLLPGCPKTPEACKFYSNYVNYGGFPDLPGDDALAETPDAKY